MNAKSAGYNKSKANDGKQMKLNAEEIESNERIVNFQIALENAYKTGKKLNDS